MNQPVGMMHVRACKSPLAFLRGVQLLIFCVDHNNKPHVPVLTEWREVDPAREVSAGNTIALDHQAPQELMDSLWECGIRPSEGSGSAGSMKAAQDNLQDLRRVTNGLFGLLGDKTGSLDPPPQETPRGDGKDER